MIYEYLNDFFTSKYFGNQMSDYFIALMIIAIALIIGKIIFWFFEKWLKKFTKKTKTNLDDILIDIVEKPLVFIIVIIGFNISYRLLTFSEKVVKFFQNTSSILVLLTIAYFMMKLVDSLLVAYIKPMTEKTKTDLDDVLLPMVRKLSKIIIAIIVLIQILYKFGYDITSLIAGLGIGGLALAFAAKDILANFFGGATIISDKPFKLNDRVRIDKYDGQVEEIGLRSTRIRTLDGTLVVVPNAKISDNYIENVSKEDARKVVYNLGLTYNTSPSKIKKAIEILNNILSNNPELNQKHVVTFDNFGDFSLNILVIFYIINPDNVVQIKNDINFKILEEFNKSKIEFAFPTQTIELKK